MHFCIPLTCEVISLFLSQPGHRFFADPLFHDEFGAKQMWLVRMLADLFYCLIFSELIR